MAKISPVQFDLSSVKNRIIDHVMLKPAEILDHPAQAWTHPAEQANALAGALREIGIVDELLVYRSERAGGQWVTPDGHLRKSLDPNLAWPCTVLNITDAESDYILLTKDPIGMMKQADQAALDTLLQSVHSGEAAVQQMLADLAQEHGLYPQSQREDPGPQLDKAAELQQKWGTALGQLWVLDSGRGHAHRLVCGDCTDRAVVERVMGGKMASLVVTDPPYGVEYAEKNKFLNAVAKGNCIQADITGDHGTKNETQALWKAAFEQMDKAMLPGAVVYCFMPQGGDQMMMMMMMMGAGIEPRHELIWLKNNHVLGRVDYAYKHEPILYAWKDGGHKFYGDFQTSILEFPKPQQSNLHPTTKPVELIERLVTNSSQIDEIVFDPFLGSGTTLIACEKFGRQCRAVEIEPRYCAVTLQRFYDMTGTMPVLVDK
jgi:site-specific DNA-methyltransferase (adenine-specific)